jgi:ubiquinone/menaquinone biosynthesis C-methylase UbiE
METKPDETKDIAKRYASRNNDDVRYSLLRREVLYGVHERQKLYANFFKNAGNANPRWLQLKNLNLVEVGCGTGSNLLEFLRMGFTPRNLKGIELLKERFEIASQMLPSSLELLLGDACEAPIIKESQDVVLVSTVFSSLLDDAFQKQLADAIWSWVRSGGAVLW